jgi:hypothetical protein
MKIFGIPVATTIDPKVVNKENIQNIVQEILKKENITSIVEKVTEEMPGNMEVTLDLATMKATHSSTQIIEHLDADGTVVLKLSHGAYVNLFGIYDTTVLFRGFDATNGQTELVTFGIFDDASASRTVTVIAGNSTGGVLSNIDFSKLENGSYTETIDGEVITHEVTFDEQDRPTAIDGCTIVWGSA